MRTAGLMRLICGVCILLNLCLKSDGQSDCNNEVDQNEAEVCGASGSFINLCGLCVGGQTGRADSEGLDRCNVCLGDNRCVGCDDVVGSNKVADACGACLAPDDAAQDNCTRITSVFPTSLDRAVDKVVTVNVRGAGISPSSLPDVSCSLEPTTQQQGREALRVEKLSVEDGLIQLQMGLTDRLGLYTINCSSNSKGPVDTGNGVALLIVDSKQLCVTASKPTNVSVGDPFQMELTIPSLAAGSSVVCYVRRKDQQTVEVVQAAEVETGRVQCSAYVAQRASRMEWGAAYTWDAAIDREGCASPVNLTANALPPVMQLAQFTDDLRKVRIVFDHNVDGSENCADIFTPDTLSLLGNGANCSFVANSLIVTLGVNPTLQGNSTLQLRDDSKVFREQSDPSLTTPASGKVMLTSPDPKTSSPQFEVMAPMLICPDTRMGSALGRTSVMPDSGAGGNTQFIRIVPYGAQKLEYSWTVNFSAQAKDQRHNLMVWRSVRMLQTQLKKASKPLQSNQIAINTSMLMPGIEYKISVTAGNVLGAQSQTREFSFQVMNASGPGASQLVLKGPTTTRGDADLYLEAMLMSCEPQIMQPALNYQWNIDGDLAQKVELSKGSRLRLRSGVLQGGKTYNISVACSSDSKEPAAVVNASAWQNVTVLSGGIQACISKQAVALGTGQALQLDASASRDLDHSAGNLQFSWCCQRLLGGRCLLPRAGEAVTLQSAFKNEFSQPVLSLPAGVLPVGRYVFTVEVSKAGGAASKAQTLVEVMPGSPALVNVPLGMQLSPVNPKVGVTVPAVVMDTREGCRMWWSVLQEPGREFLDLAEVVGLGDPVLVTLEESRDVMGREFPLVIPGPTGTWPGLKDNAGYKLRLSVACPKQQTSYADFLIITNSPPSVKALKVSPEEGEALRTRFTFSTEAADDSVADLPLLYRFGYRIGEQEPSHIFSMSNVELHADTILPAAMSVVPTLEVCDVNNLCSAVEGTSVTVKLPTNLTLAEVQQVGAQFRDHVAAGQYVEAQSLALASLQTLKRLPDQSLHTAATEIIEAEIRKELKHQQDRLDMNSGSLQSSLDFLDMSIKVLSELPMSGSTLQDLVAFKDKILSLAKHSGELKQKYSSFSDRQKKPSRHRRSNQGSPQIPVLELKNVETMLKLSEREIKEGNSSAILQAKKKLLNEVHTYMFNLCFGKEMLVALESVIVWFSVQKLTSREHIMRIADFPVPDRMKLQPPPKQTALVHLGQTVADRLGSSGKACLGGAWFPSDYLTDVTLGTKTQIFIEQKRASPVFEVWLANAKELHNVTLEHPVTVKLPIVSAELQAGQQFQCSAWQVEAWSPTHCVTDEKVQTIDAQQYVECHCRLLGYYTVLITDAPTTPSEAPSSTSTTITSTTVTTTATTTTTTTTESTTSTSTVTTTTDITSSAPEPDMTTVVPIYSEPCKDLPSSAVREGMPVSNDSYSITFRIDADFNVTVGQHKEQFEQQLRCEILQQVDMPGRMIQRINVAPGSIVVTVQLVDTDVKTAKEVIPVIAHALQSGELDVHGLDRQKLSVPQQTLTIVEPYRADKSNAVVYAVVGAVVVSTFAIFTLVTGAVIVKRKKEAERLRQKQIPSVTLGVPTYRQFQFEHSIEGTEASLARYRSSYPTMGTAGTLMMGTAMARPGARYETQFLHPDISYNSSQASRKRKNKKKKKKNLLSQEELPPGDHDSGIVDPTDDRNSRYAPRDKKNLSGSTTEFDVLPGTPTDDP